MESLFCFPMGMTHAWIHRMSTSPIRTSDLNAHLRLFTPYLGGNGVRYELDLD